MLAGFFSGYFAHMQERFELLGAPVMDVGTTDAGAAGLGLVLMADYLVRPTTILVLYLLVEGVVRGLSASISNDVVGHLPLHALNSTLKAFQPSYAEWAMGPRVIDRVKHVEGKPYDLLVATCRQKPTWDRHITISYEDELYEVMKEVDSRPPYRFMYELRKNPVWRVTRRILPFDPKETLQTK